MDSVERIEQIVNKVVVNKMVDWVDANPMPVLTKPPTPLFDKTRGDFRRELIMSYVSDPANADAIIKTVLETLHPGKSMNIDVALGNIDEINTAQMAEGERRDALYEAWDIACATASKEFNEQRKAWKDKALEFSYTLEEMADNITEAVAFGDLKKARSELKALKEFAVPPITV